MFFHTHGCLGFILFATAESRGTWEKGWGQRIVQQKRGGAKRFL